MTANLEKEFLKIEQRIFKYYEKNNEGSPFTVFQQISSLRDTNDGGEKLITLYMIKYILLVFHIYSLIKIQIFIL